MAKLEKNQYPQGSSADDFKCFGPVAVKDTEFDSFKMADLGCFQQEEKGKTKDGDSRVIDSNKFYHAAVVQHKKSGKWYLYVEFGRVGKTSTFQFTECTNEHDAMRAFASQCAEKNTKRGQWETVAGIKMFVPKKDSKGQLKDMYAVQQLASRSFGLPDARNISVSGALPQSTVSTTKAKKKQNRCDPQTSKLMADLLGGTISYARTSIQGGTIPSLSALNDGRDLLQSAKQRVAKVGNDVKSQVKDRDLKQITYALYSKIPKIKPIGASEDTWILSQENIVSWEQDIDAFESALAASDFEAEDDGNDPMQGMPLDMEWVDLKSDLGEYISNWWRGADGKNHQYRTFNILNLWKINRHKETQVFKKEVEVVQQELRNKNIQHRPLHQDKKRYDISVDERKMYYDNNIALLFHGSRSCNVAGILKENFRLPKQLVGVTLNASMFGGGIYAADRWHKSANYCSVGNAYYSVGGSIPKRRAFMFACDVVVGSPHLADGAHGFTKAPDGHHSVFGKAGHTSGWGGTLANNEWIVYKSSQVLMKYLIEFDTK